MNEMPDIHGAHDADARRWSRRADELRERWSARHPEAAEEMEGGFRSRQEIAEWSERYPQAAAEDIRVALFGPELIRSRRMTEPNWEPPEHWADGL